MLPRFAAGPLRFPRGSFQQAEPAVLSCTFLPCRLQAISLPPPCCHRQVDDLRGAVLAVSPDTRAGRIGFKASAAAHLTTAGFEKWRAYAFLSRLPPCDFMLLPIPALMRMRRWRTA